MDQKTANFILKSVESLQQKQQTIVKEVMKISDAFKNTIEKMRNERDEEKHAVDNKLEGLHKRSDNLEIVVNEHEVEIAKIVEEKTNLDTLIKKIDEKLDDYEEKIDGTLKKIEDLKTEKDENEIKQCSFDRKGYCKQEENCKFFHSQEVCSKYLETGVCNKTCCRKRHPRHCRYFLRGVCSRGELCKFLHDQDRRVPTCRKCEKMSNTKYYCEFCANSFCPECTVSDAHENNIYTTNGSVNCSNIHY